MGIGAIAGDSSVVEICNRGEIALGPGLPGRVSILKDRDRARSWPAGREIALGELRVEKGEAPPAIDEFGLGPKDLLCRTWPQRSEALDEGTVLRGDLAEIPGITQQSTRFPHASEPGAKRDERSQGLLTGHRRDLRLAIDMWRYPDAGAQRAETRPSQLGPDAMTDIATLLGDPEENEEPLSVPSFSVAEPIDSLGAGAEHPSRVIGEGHPRSSSDPSTDEPACVDAASHGSASRSRFEAQDSESSHKSLLPNPVAIREDKLAKYREESGTGARRPDSALTKLTFHRHRL
jgi:hypothetical protein